ncbi:uncharacterized protein N7511_006681 [Penicillium nucicola]|uniref:uncharacterized protein n=1 Tax=Penicillium nucicola TaxID=1850975 RepID=UPI0025456692|nr:uncharacterized protein N7511_006681 [Penicillium nucicola]KAJ5757987.1 hypothetical protein N7511_006681 [Penicillium nucicola]
MPPLRDFDEDSFSLTNIEHEIMGTSTRRVDEPELDYDIHTSTLDQAFPDFSQIQTSEEEGEELTVSDIEMSVELGRGAGKAGRDDSRSSVMSFENSVRSSSPAIRVEYPTPQKPSTRPQRRAMSENLRKNAQVRRATQAQKETMSPQVSKSQRDQRRTFSDMHAKVRDNYDGSFLGDERPAPVSTKTRSTRFGNANTSQEIADAVERASRDAYAKELRKSTSGTPRKPSANAVNNNIGDTMTHQSFLLPDLPNISELVSGVYEDGTPVYNRQGKMRSTRFVSPLHDHTEMSLPHDHFPLDAVPVPEDEKALFVSLRLLQDKVAELNMWKSDAERRMENYRQENASLKSSKTRHSVKYDSEDNEHKKGSKRLANENQKLEAANLELQNQLDIADRKAQVQESAIKRLNHERESAISQLGAAYLENRELKTDNEELRQENADLKSQISRSSHRKNREQDTLESEASSTVSDADDSQLYTERSADMSRSTKDLTSKSARSHIKSRRQDDSRSKVSNQVDKEIHRLEKERADEALFSIEVPTPRRTSGSKSSKPTTRTVEAKSSRKQPNTSKQRVKRVVVEDVSSPVEVTEQTKESSDADYTLLSVIDEHEIARLRKTLEEERLMRKQRRSSIPKESNPTETVNSTRQSILKTPAPRKSSIRESKPIIPRPASAAGDITTGSRATTDGETSLTVPIVERSRRHSDISLPPTTPLKKTRPAPDMTSAFILPDITLHHADLAANDPSKLPQATQKALDSLAQHDGKNCTVCHGRSNDNECNHEPVKVPKPVPVSERMPKPSVYNEEPTMRPSQPPAVALATVLKSLEDELSHLKMQLATYQSAFNKLDASLGKRPRKALLERIDKLLKDVDMKSDQIYALYDVLEGQKQDGHEITEQEMEMTLESIGIDFGASHAPDMTGTTDKSSRHTDQIDLDDEEDLPWEGIESTTEMTGHLSIRGH